MKLSVLFLPLSLAVAVAGHTAGVRTVVAPHELNKFPEEAVSAFLSSDNVTLYSIEEGETGKENIHGYKVAGKAKINKDETAAILADLNKSLTDKNFGSLCFHPHHALRAELNGHTYDMIICYLCGQVLTYGLDSTALDDAASANSIQGVPDVINRIGESHGLPKPRVLVEQEKIIQQAKRDYEQSLIVMPQSIRPFFPPSISQVGNNTWPDDSKLREALAKQYPDSNQRILALFAWYGSDGQSGYPEKLLQDYSFTDLWREAQSDQLTTAQLRGAARFFAGKYIAGPDEGDRRVLRDAIRKYSEEMAHWLQIMPASIQPLWKDYMWRYRDYGNIDERVHADEKIMLEALSRQFSDENERILTLFNWYGSDASEMRIFGRYQYVVDDLLYKFATSELAQAAASKPLTEQQLDGATRLFAEWEFRRGRRAEMRKIPSSLKAILMAHSKKAGNEATFKAIFAESRPMPGDGIIHPFVRQVVANDDDDYVDFVTEELTRAEPQFAAMMRAGTTGDAFIQDSPTGDAGGACINTGKAQYLINKHHVLLFEVLVDCGHVARGYGYVICRLGGDLRCSEAPDWYFITRTYELTNEGLKVDGAAPYVWRNPIEAQKRLRAMAARISNDKERTSRRGGAFPSRWIRCRVLDPPNNIVAFPCPATGVCTDSQELDATRDGDLLNMNSSVGRWIQQRSEDPDASKWACWSETH